MKKINFINPFNDAPDRTVGLQQERLIMAQEEANRINRDLMRERALERKKDIQGKQQKDNNNITQNLLSVLSNKGRKYKIVRKMIKLFSQNDFVSNLDLARCIKQRLSNADYQANPKPWKKRIRNRLRTVKKFIEKLGYSVLAVNTPQEGYRFLHN